MMSPEALAFREAQCAACPAPCPGLAAADWRARPCAACPLPEPRWFAWGCAPAEPPPDLPGDVLAARIERHILAPVEQAIPAAAPVVDAVRRCGGCTAARHQLGSSERHPDAAAPII